MAVVKSKKKTTNRDWYHTGWRSALGWSYVIICLFDFTIMPVLFNILEYWNPGQQISAYQAITLQGSGLFHISMGAIVGLNSHGRTKEKIAEISPKIPEE